MRPHARKIKGKQEDRFMPRGRKKLTLEENRTQELYEELQGLLEEKKRQELEKLSDALEEAGVSVEEVLEHIRTQESETDTANIA